MVGDLATVLAARYLIWGAWAYRLEVLRPLV